MANPITTLEYIEHSLERKRRRILLLEHEIRALETLRDKLDGTEELEVRVHGDKREST